MTDEPLDLATRGTGRKNPTICLFDVNETLLDIETISPLFHRLFGEKEVLREWFAQLVLYSLAITLSGPHISFFELGQGVFRMLGDIRRVTIAASDIDELRTRMLTMPAHPDVPSGLERLRDAGFRLASCTNSPHVPGKSPLENAGIDHFFENSFSVSQVRRFKPAAQVYHMVVDEMKAAPEDICMVAAHMWDTLGAQSIGCAGALITRPGNAQLRVQGIHQPQITAPDIPSLAAQMIELWR